MTCEHEKTRFAFEQYGFKEELIKKGYLFSKMIDQSLNSDQKAMYFMHGQLCRHVYANYYMFSISETRMIGMINPWFRLHYDENKIKIAQGVPDVFPCKLSREAIEPNKNRYVNVKDINSTPYMSTSDYDSKDEYIYKIKDLKLEEVYLINCLMLDRVAEVVGFVNTNKVIKSINVYSKLKSHINNYDGLKSKLIDLGYNFSNSEKYQKIADNITWIEFSKEERKYIDLMFIFKNKMKDVKI